MTLTCNASSCERTAYRKKVGLCRTHSLKGPDHEIRSWTPGGNPTRRHRTGAPPGRQPRPLIDRLEERSLTTPLGCRVWLGAQAGKGYGKLKVRKRQAYVHRVAYELFVAPIPEGHEVDHLCFNKLCWEPTHLEAVTPEENQRRAEERRLFRLKPSKR